jgi:hypothetical protein
MMLRRNGQAERLVILLYRSLLFFWCFHGVLTDDACRFEDPTLGVIDLSTVGKSDGSAAYSHKKPSAGAGFGQIEQNCWAFSSPYHPCLFRF